MTSQNNPLASINQAIAAPMSGVFDLKFHQVAIYTDNVMRDITMWKDMGYEEWSYDTAKLVGKDRGVPTIKQATMAFNYDILPLELEYVSYNGPRNREDERTGFDAFLSHCSTIVHDVEEKMLELKQKHGLEPYHQFVTQDHTNPNVQGIKRFKEAIYDTRHLLGFDIKLIQRVPWDFRLWDDEESNDGAA